MSIIKDIKSSTQKKPVEILDAICGSGKSTSIFKYMNNNPNKRYLYISIYKSEVGCNIDGIVGRVQKECPSLNFKALGDPTYNTKLGEIREYLRSGDNIAATHNLFNRFDEDIANLMIQAKYTLIIDESVDVLRRYDKYTRDDIRALTTCGMVFIDEDTDRLCWNEDKYPHYNGTFNSIKSLCRLGSLALYKQDLVIHEYPPLLMKELDEVIIITYLFEGSIMCSWLKKNKIPYTYINTIALGLKSEEDIKKRLRDQINVVFMHSLKRLRDDIDDDRGAFNHTWYETQLENNDKDGYLSQTKTVLESFVRRYKKPTDKLFWTSYKNVMNVINGKGYTKTPKNGLSPWIAFNTKAVNDYHDYTKVMYTVNVNKSNVEIGYLKERGIEFDRDTYALSELVQTVFRGVCRKDTDEKMDLLILSPRMEKLFLKWLEK